MQVGLGYTARDFCDGQSLAPLGRWAPADSRYPESRNWMAIVEIFRRYAATYASAELLVSLSLGRVSLCPFPMSSITELKNLIITRAHEQGYGLHRAEGDREDVPVDFRFTDLLLRLAWRSGNRPGCVRTGCARGFWRENAEAASTVSVETSLASSRTG